MVLCHDVLLVPYIHIYIYVCVCYLNNKWSTQFSVVQCLLLI